MKPIRIDRSFFIKERQQVYGNWTEALFRELIQNLVDAEATSVSIDTMNFPTIVIADNGPGMTLEVLETVYMQLGASTKGGSDTNSVGGFGRARILTCFSHPNWRIESQDWVCYPDETGTHYIVETGQKFYHGFRITITVDTEDGYVEKWHLDDACRSYLRECQLANLLVMLNGEEINDAKAEHKLTFLVDILDGKLFEQSFLPNNIVVRVNGLSMFSTYVGNHGPHSGYLLELNPATSRSHLSASRDALRGKMKEEFDSIVRAAHKGEFDKFMKPTPNITEALGGGKLQVVEAKVKVSRLRSLTIWGTAAVESISSSAGSVVTGGFAALRRMFSTEITSRELSHHERQQEALEATRSGRGPQALSLYFNKCDIAFLVHTNDQELRKQAEAWRPHDWQGSVVDGFVFWSASCKHKAQLLKAFTNAVNYYANVLSSITGSSYTYLTGFNFNRNAIGEVVGCEVEGHGYTKVVTICPLGKSVNGNFIQLFPKLDTDGLMDIGAIAAHEVAHLHSSYHGDEWGRVLTEMVSRVPTEDLLRSMRVGL